VTPCARALAKARVNGPPSPAFLKAHQLQEDVLPAQTLAKAEKIDESDRCLLLGTDGILSFVNAMLNL
jgi:hypothetical protein